MPPNKGATGRKTDAIHFVNARPSSESEKVYIQRLVRAHVGKWISDQTKDRSDPSDSSLCENHEKAVISPGHPVELDAEEALFPSSPPSLGSPHSPESNTSNSTSVIRFSSRSTWESQQTSSVTHPCPIHSGNSGLFKLDSSYTESQFVASSMNDSPSPPPPGESIETFGASMLDPFLTYPSQYAPDLVHARENYCTYLYLEYSPLPPAQMESFLTFSAVGLTILWPGLTPDSEDGSVMASSSWFPLSLSEPTLFTAFLFGSLSHQRVQWLNRWIPEGSFRARDQQLLELCQFETIKMINREVRNPNRAVCDAVILSVVCLAHSIADDSDEQRLRKTPFNAPLRRLQWLDVYGSLPPNLIHVQGLVQMVRLRGGLENIKLPGLAPILSL
ncbi:hypothetical protein EYZ11_009930 [Aspergillus tanneri]|uniref:Transcription factor domain-containing protein n=1 Tax=Aspergillus tanneri TaxID=1220188 RepID=A0A4S3J6X4_9EURO|nr:hypothetical protein EYZ11_009930 [Aspergillus tanneri]